MRIPVFPTETIEFARKLAQEARTARELRMSLSVLLPIDLSLTLPRVGQVLGRSRSSVIRMQKAVRNPAARKPLWGGRRRGYLSLNEEKEFLAGFCREASKGLILEVGAIKRAYETIVGSRVNKTTIYRMLARHGWRKIAPRPVHPKADLAEQAEFKKNFRSSWQPT